MYSTAERCWIRLNFVDAAQKEYHSSAEVTRASGNVWVTKRSVSGEVSIQTISETKSEYSLCNDHPFSVLRTLRQRKGKRT